MRLTTATREINLLLCSLITAGMGTAAAAQGLADYDKRAQRLVTTFDFDEREEGNLEDVPMYWEPLDADAFAHFAYGRFDFDEGREAAPSFHLVSKGRSVAYHYRGEATRVRAKSEYRITGYIKPSKLHHGRACLSAHFLNAHGEPLGGIFARSRFVGGPSDDEGWVGVELFLPAAPPQAYTIGLIAWVLQDSAWNTAPRPRRYIPHKDVFGSARFDDIAIYTLPRVELSSTGSGNVLDANDDEALLVTVADHGDTPLDARLSISTVHGALVETHAVEVAVGTTVEPSRVPVSHLEPGAYVARIDVADTGHAIASRQLRFLRLAPTQRDEPAMTSAFGIVLRADQRAPLDTEFALLRKLGVGSVKVPVWSGRAAEQASSKERRATSLYLQKLSKYGYELTAVLAGPPAPIVRAGGRFTRPLIDLLADEPSAWEDHLSTVAAPYASIFRSWQLGGDDDARAFSPHRVGKAVKQFRSAIRRFIHTPTVAYAVNPHIDFGDESPELDEATVVLEAAVSIDDYASLLSERRKTTRGRVHAYVPTKPVPVYRREADLADWARALIAARHGGASTVFTSQLWSVRETSADPVIEPSDKLLVLRTIARILGNATPRQSIRLGEGVTALAFRRGEEMLVAAWDSSAFRGPRPHAIQLGSSPTHSSLRGASLPIRRLEDGRHEVMLSTMPSVIGGVEPWVVDLRAALRIVPARVDSGREGQRFAVEIPYRGRRSVTGRIALQTPKGWDAAPRQFEFKVMPQRMERKTINVQIPHNDPVGAKPIVASLVTSDRRTVMEVPLHVTVELSDVDVSGMAVIEGDVLRLRHVVTNRSKSILSFRGSASVPGRERQYRPFTNLMPGDSQTVEYRFGQASGLIGRAVRLGLRELNDGPRTHSLEIVVP